MGINTGLAVKDNDTIGKIGGHGEIVLNNEGSLFGVHDETLNDSRGNNTLLRVKVGRGLVKEVNIRRHTKGKNNGNTLQFTTGQVLNFLINEVIELKGLDDVSLELRRQESLLNLLEEQLANSTLELGGNGLGLHADSHVWDRALAVWLNSTSEETAESGLAGSILSHHDNNFRVGELSSINTKSEVAKGLLNLGVGKGTRSVNGEVVGSFSKAESKRLFTESQVLGGNVTVQENVDTFTNRVRHSDNTIDGGLSVENADVIGEIVESRQIVLDDDDVVIVADKRANHLGGAQTLLDIEIRRRLVKHVDIGLLDANRADGKTLKFTTREQSDVSVHDVVQLQNPGHFLGVSKGGTALDKVANALLRATDSLGNLIDILGLDNSLKIILQELSEVVYVCVKQVILLDCRIVTHSAAQSHGSA